MPDATAMAATPSPLATAVAVLARRIDARALGNGGLARLRRLSPESPNAPEFWRLLGEIAEAAGGDRIAGEGSERGWAMVMAGMARMAPNHHRTGRAFSPGRALAATDYPEARLRRLLRTEPDSPAFVDAVRAAAGWLALRGHAVDWTGLASLALARHEAAAEEARRRLARDYYTALDHADPEDATPHD